jgi:hypothetical protein
MSRSYQFLAVVVVGLGMAIALLIPPRQVVSADPKPAAEPAVGRYQVFKSTKNLPDDCLLDTATGKAWRLKVNGLQGEWVLFAEGPK